MPDSTIANPRGQAIAAAIATPDCRAGDHQGPALWQRRRRRERLTRREAGDRIRAAKADLKKSETPVNLGAYAAHMCCFLSVAGVGRRRLR